MLYRLIAQLRGNYMSILIAAAIFAPSSLYSIIKPRGQHQSRVLERVSDSHGVVWLLSNLFRVKNGFGGSRDVLKKCADHDRRNDEKHEKLRGVSAALYKLLQSRQRS